VCVDGGSSLGTISAFNPAPGVGTDSFVVSKGNHTINITAQDDGYFPVMAIKCWDRTIPAVDLFQAGVYGASVGYFTVNTNSRSPLNGFDYIAPDLTTTCLTINDAANLTPIADYVGLLSAIIEKAQLTGDVQLVSGIPYNGVTSTD
jgi:hypothetical protein